MFVTDCFGADVQHYLELVTLKLPVGAFYERRVQVQLVRCCCLSLVEPGY